MNERFFIYDVHMIADIVGEIAIAIFGVTVILEVAI